jgi:hypothetical protein
MGLAAVGLSITACAQEADPPAREDGSGSAPPDAAVLRSYVEALAEGDVERAIELRCTEGRPEGSSRAQFEKELETLVDALGPPELARVDENDPPTGVAAWVEGAADDPEERWRARLDGVELQYWLSFGGVELDDPLLAVVVDQGRERRICGHATFAADHIFEVVDDDIRDAGLPAARELADLMPASIGDGYRQVQDDSSTPEHLPGAVEGHSRAWQEVGEHAGARVSAVRFTSPEVALAWAGHRAREVAGDAVQMFDVPRLDGEVGVRVSASSWLLVQPAGEPPFVDQVTFVTGAVGVSVDVTESGDVDPARAVEISHQVADLARS